MLLRHKRRERVWLDDFHCLGNKFLGGVSLSLNSSTLSPLTSSQSRGTNPDGCLFRLTSYRAVVYRSAKQGDLPSNH